MENVSIGERERRGERENKRMKEKEREKNENEGEGMLSLFNSHFLLFRPRYASLHFCF